MIPRMTKLCTVLLLSLLFIVPAAGFGNTDDEFSDSSATVLRIKFLDGKAEVRRVDSDNWETAVLNLPLVEGDQVRTGKDSRLEIQFNNDTYLRLDENSNIKLVSLGQEGSAVSLTRGALILSVLTFDSANGYLEVDAPRTTVAIADAGRYRIEADSEYSRSVSVDVRDGGTARVYSLDSGFTLKNDQSAKMALDGTYAGEWSVSRSNGGYDAFDDWSASRDNLINQSLKDSYYGSYYDNNLYGADDLNYYGSWQRDNTYGYLWSPYNSAISMYNNWSPYRYGQWRWLPYYGWTWVNNEPWGWATYHYGRWIYLRGRWYWTPYSYNNFYGGNRRSWWRPAIVYMGSIGNRICWYPLPYNYSYYDYNRRYRNRWNRYRRNRRTDRNTDQQETPNPANVARGTRNRQPPLTRIPGGAVVTTSNREFGKGKGRFDTAPIEISKQILSQKPVINRTPPLIPSPGNRVTVKTPGIIPSTGTADNRKVKMGAGDRKLGQPLDKELKTKRIRANRPPLTTMPRVVPNTPAQRKAPRTGVFDRSNKTETNRSTPKRTITPPIYRPRTPERKVNNPTPPVYKPTPAPRKVERKSSPPIYSPAPRKAPVERKTSPPVRRTPPPRKSSPPPQRRPSSPRTKSPPVRSAPKKSSKPAPKPPSVKKPDN